MYPADGLGEHHADVHRLDLVTLHLLDLVGDRVRHHHLKLQGQGCFIGCHYTHTLLYTVYTRV